MEQRVQDSFQKQAKAYQYDSYKTEPDIIQLRIDNLYHIYYDQEKYKERLMVYDLINWNWNKTCQKMIEQICSKKIGSYLDIG
ncbi:hypothetical protein pb186bvf_019070 [Paramecium bursaria]